MLRFCKLESHTREVNCCAFSSNYFVTCSGDKSVCVYTTGTFKELPYSPLKSFQYGINHVTFSPDEAILAAAGTDGKAHLFTLSDKTAKVFAIFRHSGTNTVQVCVFSTDSQYLVTGSADGSIALWDVEKKKLIKEIAGHAEGMVHAIAFTPCNSFLVTGSTLGDLRVWNMWNNLLKLTQLQQAHEDGISSCGVSCIDFSPSFHTSVTDPSRCYLMASCGHDNKIKLWILDIRSQKLKLFQTLSGHFGPVSGCCFSSDGKHLASSSFDKTIIVWDPILCEQVYLLDGHAAFCTFVAYSTDDDYIASTSYDKSCIIWHMPKEDGTNFPQLAYELPENDLIQFKQSPEVIEKQQPASIQSSSTSAASQPRIPFQQWSSEEVTKWLTDELKLGQYAASFSENEIDGAELTGLTNAVLQNDLNVGPLGHRNKILRAIKAMDQNDQKQGDINLQSMVKSLPPSLKELAPSMIQHYTKTKNEEAASTGGTSFGSDQRQWQPVPAAQKVTVHDVRQSKIEAEKDIPDEYLCPITREVMSDPVIASDGFSYERTSIAAWLKKGNNRSPMTSQPLSSKRLVPNQTLKTIIVQFMENMEALSLVEGHAE